MDSILVGGGCVSVYSKNRYQSYDLDYVTYEDIQKVQIALKELGFEKRGQHFEHKNCKYFVEFVSPPVSIGNEPIHNYAYHQTPFGTIKMLTPTDSIKDRLASFYHWNDYQSLEQAINIYEEIPKQIDLSEVKRWSQKEGHLKKLDVFLKKIKQEGFDLLL